MPESYPRVMKTLWEKEKLPVTSDFYFSHSVFERLVLQTRKNQGMFGKGLKKESCFMAYQHPRSFGALNPFPNDKM